MASSWWDHAESKYVLKYLQVFLWWCFWIILAFMFISWAKSISLPNVGELNPVLETWSKQNVWPFYRLHKAAFFWLSWGWDSGLLFPSELNLNISYSWSLAFQTLDWNYTISSPGLLACQLTLYILELCLYNYMNQLCGCAISYTHINFYYWFCLSGNPWNVSFPLYLRSLWEAPGQRKNFTNLESAQRVTDIFATGNSAEIKFYFSGYNNRNQYNVQDKQSSCLPSPGAQWIWMSNNFNL